MSAQFQKSIDSIFRRMGIGAKYQILGRDPQPVQVILRQSDPLVELNDRPLLVNHYQFDVRVNECAEPKRGDLFLVDDQRYRIEDEPQLDQHRLVWRMTVLAITNQQTESLAMPMNLPASDPTINIQPHTTRLRVR